MPQKSFSGCQFRNICLSRTPLAVNSRKNENHSTDSTDTVQVCFFNLHSHSTEISQQHDTGFCYSSTQHESSLQKFYTLQGYKTWIKLRCFSTVYTLVSAKLQPQNTSVITYLTKKNTVNNVIGINHLADVTKINSLKLASL